ncbi:MAG: polynucleotide adenylyltransferase PcnB [Steroidobacteraceae bacterium]
MPRIIPRSDHTVSRSSISPNALRVLYRLKDAGYQAFLVGGCVRDILLGRTPKDFDVATNALPDEVRELFRNCRLVGRRFRLAHVVFGREIIEVATFRASSAPDLADEPLPDADPEEGEAPELDAPDFEEPAGFDAPPERRHDRAQDESGRILRDNVYGTIDEDVWRRDFTANALYYNIADFSIWDYCGGVEDVHERRLRLIGDPETRYREDPVRMLRAARFEAKLGFQLDAPGLEPLARLRTLLTGVPAARLFDEMVKLFLTGHGAESLAVLRRHRLLEVLLPAVERYLARHPESLVEKLLVQGLVNTDARVAEDKPVTPVFLLALLLYGPIAAHIEHQPPEHWHEASAILAACDAALREAHARVTIPKRIAFGVRDMFALQPRLEHPRGRRSLSLLEQPRFRAAYDLLLLRAEQGLAPRGAAEWWTKLQAAGQDERERMAEAIAQRAGSQPHGAGQGAGQGAGPGSGRRRGGRRRRRRGAASAG